MAIFFGDKTQAWFDVWSFEHVGSGIAAGAAATTLVRALVGDAALTQRARHRLVYAVVLLQAYAWETLEHYLEAGTTGISTITHWFQGVEFWGNRLVTDPLLMVAGAAAALAYPWMAGPARVFSMLWLLVHIFLFPHSMYLHTIEFSLF